MTTGTAVALGGLFDETVLLYLRLSALAAHIHRKGPLSGPRRTVLVTLARSGPRTVAHMARERSQSRQRLQPLVNALIDDGLLQAMPNEAHRQSPLIALTAKGRKAVERIHRVESEGRSRLALRVSEARVQDATVVLRDVRLALEQISVASRQRR